MGLQRAGHDWVTEQQSPKHCGMHITFHWVTAVLVQWSKTFKLETYPSVQLTNWVTLGKLLDSKFPFLYNEGNHIWCWVFCEESYDQPREHIKKQRHYFTNKGLSSQNYRFSSSHVWLWELDCKESWALKNWCFWTVVLEKTLESPLDCKEIQPVHPKGNQPWVFTGTPIALWIDVEAETPILWPPDAKSWLIGKDPDAGEDWGQEAEGTNRGWDGWMASPT